jgi:hypothetical protein
MTSFITLENKKPTLSPVSGSAYRAFILVIDETASLPEEIEGPITAGTEITLPGSETYEGNELQVAINGIDLVLLLHYNFVGAGPARTKITLTVDLDGTKADPDELSFYKD